MLMVKTEKSSKKVIAKKSSIIVLLGVIVLIAVSAVAGYYFSSWQHNQVNAAVETRKDRIIAIYDSLKLDTTYQLINSSVFGEKRVYEWDAGRTFSSEKTYDRGSDVASTVAELRKKIESAGFTYFEEPYPGSTYIELHFKSSKNEYVRLNVQSKLRFDAMRNDALMNGGNSISQTALDLDPNAGPSIVTIKVNLDDNNE